jgi:hypothetical protein
MLGNFLLYMEVRTVYFALLDQYLWVVLAAAHYAVLENIPVLMEMRTARIVLLEDMQTLQ